MLINEESYQRKTDCFKLDRDNKRRENASTVEAKVTESLTVTTATTLLQLLGRRTQSHFLQE